MNIKLQREVKERNRKTNKRKFIKKDLKGKLREKFK